MNEAYYTQLGDRADLADVEVNAPEGYIASQILPIVTVKEKTGVIYYATVTADVTAQAGRAAGAAPNGTQISDSSTTFTAAESIKRGKITPDEVKTMGSIQKADLVGAKFAKRSVMNAFEGDVAALIMASGSAADATFDPSKVRTQIQTAKQSMRLYQGQTALIAATYNIESMLQSMLSDSVYGAALARLVTGSSGVEAVRGITLEAWKQALALFFGVGKVLAGDDTVWNATAIAGRFAVGKLDDSGDELAHKYQPVLGKVFQFAPDGKNPWFVESIPDRITKNNYYDATQWYDAVILNSDAVYVFDGVPQS